jgi:hypothetical protein
MYAPMTATAAPVYAQDQLLLVHALKMNYETTFGGKNLVFA